MGRRGPRPNYYGVCATCGFRIRLALITWSKKKAPVCFECGQDLQPSPAALQALHHHHKTVKHTRETKCRHCPTKLRSGNDTGYCAVCQGKVMRGAIGDESERTRLRSLKINNSRRSR